MLLKTIILLGAIFLCNEYKTQQYYPYLLKNGNYKLMNYKGQFLKTGEFKEAYVSEKTKKIICYNNQEVFVLDKYGKPFFQGKYEKFYHYLDLDDGATIIYSKKGKLGAYNVKFRTTLKCEYDIFSFVKNGTLIFKKGVNFYCVDNNLRNTYFLGPSFSSLESGLSDDLLIRRYKDSVFVHNLKGKILVGAKQESEIFVGKEVIISNNNELIKVEYNLPDVNERKIFAKKISVYNTKGKKLIDGFFENFSIENDSIVFLKLYIELMPNLKGAINNEIDNKNNYWIYVNAKKEYNNRDLISIQKLTNNDFFQDQYDRRLMKNTEGVGLYKENYLFEKFVITNVLNTTVFSNLNGNTLLTVPSIEKIVDTNFFLVIYSNKAVKYNKDLIVMDSFEINGVNQYCKLINSRYLKVNDKVYDLHLKRFLCDSNKIVKLDNKNLIVSNSTKYGLVNLNCEPLVELDYSNYVDYLEYYNGEINPIVIPKAVYFFTKNNKLSYFDSKSNKLNSDVCPFTNTDDLHFYGTFFTVRSKYVGGKEFYIDMNNFIYKEQ